MISADERRRREKAVQQALASVGLEGFNVPPSELARVKKFINGEISLGEFVETPFPTLLYPGVLQRTS